MLIYKDILSGDELFSDSYPIKLVDGLFYEVEGKTIKESGDIDEALIGGNKATDATEEDESVDSSVITGINIVLTGKYNETGFDKASFKDWLKTYMKELAEIVKKKHPADVADQKVKEFQQAMQKWAMMVLKSFDDWRFYQTETMPEKGMIVLMNYREDQITPYFTYFKDGLVEEKY